MVVMYLMFIGYTRQRNYFDLRSQILKSLGSAENHTQVQLKFNLSWSKSIEQTHYI